MQQFWYFDCHSQYYPLVLIHKTIQIYIFIHATNLCFSHKNTKQIFVYKVNTNLV